MKVGDLVKYVDERHSALNGGGHLGLVLEVLTFGHPSQNNICVKWNNQRIKNLWHHVNDLEVINESR